MNELAKEILNSPDYALQLGLAEDLNITLKEASHLLFLSSEYGKQTKNNPLSTQKLEIALKKILKKDITSYDLFKDCFSNNGLLTGSKMRRGQKIYLQNFSIISKETSIACGLIFLPKWLPFAKTVKILKKEGEKIFAGDILVTFRAPSILLLCFERVILNLIQRMCGVAKKTHQLKEAIPREITLLDTRKTTPGLRLYEKYATLVGGAHNHRMGLYDHYMLKDNHIRLNQTVRDLPLIGTRDLPLIGARDLSLIGARDLSLIGAIETISKQRSKDREIWEKLDRRLSKERKKQKKSHLDRYIVVECENVQQVDATLQAFEKGLLVKNDRIMLDNMNEESIRNSILKIKNRLPVEVSGNIDETKLETLKKLVEENLKITYVSSGAITRKATSSDISLEVV